MKDDNLIFRKKVSASEIFGQYPPIWHDDYKQERKRVTF
jgi:hypothetical protein